MGTVIDEDAWKSTTETALSAIVRWRQEHPAATFDEIEAAVTQHLRVLRQQVLTDTIQSSAQATFGQGADRPVCPSCGKRLQAKGRKRRTIVTHQGEEIALVRTHGHCPRCHARVPSGCFPPGSGTGTESELAVESPGAPDSGADGHGTPV